MKAIFYAIHEFVLCSISILETIRFESYNVESSCIHAIVHRARKFQYSLPIPNSILDKGLPQQAEVVQRVPGRLRPQIFLTFRHYKGSRSSALSTGRLHPQEKSLVLIFRG